MKKTELRAKFELLFGTAPKKPACYCESCELAKYKVDAARYRGLKKIFMHEFESGAGAFERVAYGTNNLDNEKFDRAVRIARLARDNGTGVIAGVKGGSWYVIGYADHTYEIVGLLTTDYTKLEGREAYTEAMKKALGSKKLRGYYGY